MVRKIKKKKIKEEFLEEDYCFFPFGNYLSKKIEFLEEEDLFCDTPFGNKLTKEEKDIKRLFEEQEDWVERCYEKIPLTLDRIEEIIESGKKIPKGKVRKLRTGEADLEFFVFLLMLIDGKYSMEEILPMQSEEEYREIEERNGKTIMKKYNITSNGNLTKVILYLLNNGVVETWKEYIAAESLEDALKISEIKKNKKAKERKYEFIKRFEGKISDEVLSAWSLKEALILVRYGKFLGYISQEEENTLLGTVVSKLLKSCQSWKEYGFSCLVGEFLERYQYGNKKIIYGDLYYTIDSLKNLLCDGEWGENPWLKF